MVEHSFIAMLSLDSEFKCFNSHLNKKTEIQNEIEQRRKELEQFNRTKQE
jgi:hypothetical protein